MMRLSICIATYNRGAFIGETLRALLAQLTPECEIIVVDGASPDDTGSVVESLASTNPRLRYFHESSNSGVDADYDKAVGYATGDYCWLFPDDDLPAPGAVRRVLATLAADPDLVIVDGAVKDVDLDRTLKPRRFGFSGERHYSAADADRLLAETGDVLSFIGATIIRRSLWLARDRARYYGSYFVHVGAVFQAPHLDKVIAIGEPLIDIRYGNSMWSPRRFEIWAFRWPELIWGFEGYSDEAKGRVSARFPWRSVKNLVSFRARGAYSYREYRRFFDGRRVGWRRGLLAVVSVLPGRLVHMVGTAYLRVAGRIDDAGAYELLKCSPYSNGASRLIATAGRRTPGGDA